MKRIVLISQNLEGRAAAVEFARQQKRHGIRYEPMVYRDGGAYHVARLHRGEEFYRGDGIGTVGLVKGLVLDVEDETLLPVERATASEQGS